MTRERKTIDICQDCHEQVRGNEYFPDAERYGACGLCGSDALIARVRKDECAGLAEYGDILAARKRLAEERASGCAPAGTVEFWQYEIFRLERIFAAV